MSIEEQVEFRDFFTFVWRASPIFMLIHVEEAIKCMRHSRRTTLSTDDVDGALSMRNVEPLYGFASGDPRRFKRALGHKDLFYVDEKDVELKDVLKAPLPKPPLDTAVIAHWLAIEGVKPCIPENKPLQALATPSDNRTAEYKEDGIPVELKLPVKHVLSRELQLYFEKITELFEFDSVLCSIELLWCIGELVITIPVILFLM